MSEIYFVFRSVTHGQRAAELLERYGVEGRLQRSPRSISSSGCAYALVLRGRDQSRAEAILRREELFFRGPFQRQINGGFVPSNR